MVFRWLLNELLSLTLHMVGREAQHDRSLRTEVIDGQKKDSTPSSPLHGS